MEKLFFQITKQYKTSKQFFKYNRVEQRVNTLDH